MRGKLFRRAAPPQQRRARLLPSKVASGAYTLTADTGTFALTGQSANLLFNRLLAAGQASYTFTGQSANLLFGRKLVANQRNFNLTGQAINLLFGRKLTAAQGSFTFTGQAATLTYGAIGTYTLTAASASFALTGKDANLLYARKMPAVVGSFTLTGFAANLTYAPPNAYVLTANTGAFTLTRQPAVLRYSGDTPIDTPFYGGGGSNFTAPERKSLRKDVEEDVKAAIAQLTHVTKQAEKVAQAKEPEPMRFEPAKVKLNDAMRDALAVIDQSLSAIERTQVQMALAHAREAQRKLEAVARDREAQEVARIEMEAAIRRARRHKAAAAAAAFFFGDED